MKYNLSIDIKKKLLKLFYKKSGIQNFPGFRVRVWVSYPKKLGIPGSGADTRTQICLFFRVLLYGYDTLKKVLKDKLQELFLKQMITNQLKSNYS